jgi:5-methylcytosine-specific restriction endonuclease McrA
LNWITFISLNFLHLLDKRIVDEINNMEHYYCKVCNKNIVIRKGDILRCTQCGYFLLTPKLPVSDILKIKIERTTFCSFCDKIVFSIPIKVLIKAITQRTKWEINNLKIRKLAKKESALTQQEENKIIDKILYKLKSALDYLHQALKKFSHVCSNCHNGVILNLKPPPKNLKLECSFCNKIIEEDSIFCKYCGAKIVGNTRYIPKEVKIEVWERDDGRCVNCGRVMDLEFDHIIPFSKGGANSVRNLQLLCSRCNKKKSNKVNG